MLKSLQLNWLAGVLVILVLICWSGVASASAEWPQRSILMVIPFNPGGATDQIGRTLEPLMEEKLGVPIAAQNMPGGATSIGNQYVFDAPHDGYTILVEPTDITSIAVMGQSKLTWQDWNILGVAAAVPAVFVIHPDSSIKSIAELATVMKEKQLSVGVAASGCAWTRAISLFAKENGVKQPMLVPMGGGHPAALAALKKEVDLAVCGVPEAIDLIKGKKLTALAYMGAEDIQEPFIPAITKAFPGFNKFVPFGGWVGMAVAKGTPVNVVAKLQNAYNYAVNSNKFKEFLAENNFLEVGLSGEDAEEYVAVSTSVNAWLLYDLGVAPISPEEFEIPRP